MKAILTLSIAIRCSLVLHFDGSIRQPCDPGYNVDSLGKLSSCAAFVRITDEEETWAKDTSRAFLGGRSLSNHSPVLTSADAEYEGLILGLEFLLRFVEEGRVAINDPVLITVHGDCKTVIDQMRGRSRPRKMEKYFRKATSLVDQMPLNVELRFIHIPRSENTVCDEFCEYIIQREEEEAIDRLCSNMAHHRDELQKGCHDGVKAGEELTSSLTVRELVNLHFEPYHSLIPYSKRPAIYAALAAMANESHDFMSMVTIGKKMEDEANAIWRKLKSRHEEAEQLLANGVYFQLLGLSNQGQQKDRSRLERKHRVLLKNQSETLSVKTSDEAFMLCAEKLCNRDVDKFIDIPNLVRHCDIERIRQSIPELGSNPFWIQV